jgi:hypothetical protein
MDPGGQRLEPPRPLLLSSDFGALDEVRLADHSDHRAGLVDHRQRADVMFDQKLDRSGDVRFTVTTSRTITSIAFMVSSTIPRAAIAPQRSAMAAQARPLLKTRW